MKFDTEILSSDNLPEGFYFKFQCHFNNCEESSPFLSPAFVQKNIDENPCYFMVSKRISTGEICLIQPYTFNKKKQEFSLYGEKGADAIKFLFTQNLTLEEKSEILQLSFKCINPAKVILRKIRKHSEDLAVLKTSLSKLNLFTCITPYINCPTATFDPESDTEFNKIFNKGNIRNSLNRLQKQAEVAFEVITNLEDGGHRQWAEDFMWLHELRWSSSNTPSIYRLATHRRQFLVRIETGLRDQTIVLFSLKVNGTRYSLVLTYKEGRRLIYHQIANHIDPEYHKLRLYKIQIRHIGEWMKQQGFSVLDFGLGQQEYKLDFANGMEPIVEIYACRSALPVKFRCLANRFYYQNEGFRKYYLAAKNNLRSGRYCLKLLWSRLGLMWRNMKDDPARFGRKLLASFTGKKTLYFKALPQDIRSLPNQLTKPELSEIFKLYEEEINLTPASRGTYIRQYLNQTKTPYALVENGAFRSIGWVTPVTEDDILPTGVSLEQAWVITDCLTAHAARGKGAYTKLLQCICHTHPGSEFLIYTDDWNLASRKGIEKAGFQLYAVKSKGNTRFLEN